MTYAELERAIDSYKRVTERKQREKASFDYILAELIGKSVSRVYNSANKMPTLGEAYPSLFDVVEEQEKIQEQKNNLSVLRFKQFAQAHNKKYKEVGNSE